MEAWLTSLLASMFSSLIVGVIMANLNKHLAKGVEDAKEANRLKFDALEQKIKNLEEKVVKVANKQDTLGEKMEASLLKMTFIATNQDNLKTAFGELKESFKEARAENFGRVIKK